MDADKVVDTYKFSRDDLESIEFGAIKTSFKFKNKFPPLTRRSGFMAVVFVVLLGGFFNYYLPICL